MRAIMIATRIVTEFDYHDYHLRSYTVSDHGATILLDLVNVPEPKRATLLQFSEVQYYRFIHTCSPIITHILDTPFLEAVQQLGTDLPTEFRQHGGISHTYATNQQYAHHFQQEGHRTWLIHSAIGFVGLIVGRTLSSPPAAEPQAELEEKPGRKS